MLPTPMRQQTGQQLDNSHWTTNMGAQWSLGTSTEPWKDFSDMTKDNLCWQCAKAHPGRDALGIYQ